MLMFQEIIVLIASIVNQIHDTLMELSEQFGWNLSDKDLHLWVFGIIGILTFAFVHYIFRILAKYSVTSISFIYTFTVMVIIVFAIEIQQKITGRGEMSFDDAVISLWGFLLFFAVFLVIKGMILLFKKRGKK
jgi:hypothetical protein